MQTTLNSVYTDHGLSGLILLMLVYAMLADRFPFLKFWMFKSKNGCDPEALAKTLHTNHIPHIESRLDVIENEIKNVKDKVSDSKSSLCDKIEDVKKSAHARMDRIELRLTRRE